MTYKTWYLGLDIGTASVGWAATDTEYKIIRKNKKRLWGVSYLKKLLLQKNAVVIVLVEED